MSDYFKKPKIITTEDGSHSLHIDELDESYHSIHGAIQESNHVFFKEGLIYFLDKSKSNLVMILEYGFGSGLNALLASKYSSGSLKILYHTIEKYPLDESITKQLNYGFILDDNDSFKFIHNTKWEEEVRISESFILRKIKADIKSYIPDEKYNIIFFDAFAPSKQPELWNKEIYKRCFDALYPKGLLVTYSAKGQLKRDLKAVGFRIETIPGPPGKLQMTRAIRE